MIGERYSMTQKTVNGSRPWLKNRISEGNRWIVKNKDLNLAPVRTILSI